MDDNFDEVRTVHHHNAEGHQGVAVYNQLRVVLCLAPIVFFLMTIMFNRKGGLSLSLGQDLSRDDALQLTNGKS